jgi:hypothetical protein
MRGSEDVLGQVASDLQEMRDAIGLWQHTVLGIWRASLREREPVSSKLIELVQATAARSLSTLRDCAGFGHDERTVRAMTCHALQFTEWAAEAQLALMMAEMDVQRSAGPWAAGRAA